MNGKPTTKRVLGVSGRDRYGSSNLPTSYSMASSKCATIFCLCIIRTCKKLTIVSTLPFVYGHFFRQDAAGAADEEMFMNAFEDVPRIMLYTSKDLDEELNQVNVMLADTNKDWEKRAESLRRLRSIMVAGALDYDEFLPALKALEFSFQLSLKDLRSKVVREACITLAYLSQQLGVKLERFCEGLLPHLFNLIPNSAKIMSTSAIVCIRFIIQYTHGARLIPVITTNMSSKSKEIRKSCCELLDQLLHTWPTHSLGKHAGLLADAIKKGLSDADSEARIFSRKAYWAYSEHLKEQAEYLMNSLDKPKQKMLYGEQVSSISASNSTNSLVNAYLYSNPLSSTRHNVPRVPNNTKNYGSRVDSGLMSRSVVSSSNSIENLIRPSSSLSTTSRNRGSGIPVFSSGRNGSGKSNDSTF